MSRAVFFRTALMTELGEVFYRKWNFHFKVA